MNMLLGRSAEALFWFARYIERTATLARILNVQAAYYQGHSRADGWQSLLVLYNDEERFAEHYSEATASNIARFYILDGTQPGSVMAALKAARENARLLRPLISVSMWSCLNVFYGEMKQLSASDMQPSQLARHCAWIAERCDAILGVTESTFYRDAGWRFYQLGLWIERADQTSRLLDVKFARFASEIKGTMPPIDPGFWYLLLRSFDAYHAFQRVESGRMEPRLIADFIMFNKSFPRSLASCIDKIQYQLNALYLGYHLRHAAEVSQQVDALAYGLVAAREDPLLHERFHGFNDWVQRELMVITDMLGAKFFLNETVSPQDVPDWSAPATGQNQSQNQQQDHTGQSQKQG